MQEGRELAACLPHTRALPLQTWDFFIPIVLSGRQL
jgi:hypothetical protein